MDNPLLLRIGQILTAKPEVNWSEHGLIRRLVDDGQLSADFASDFLALFQTHFLVMNALYQLRLQFAAAGQGLLHISALDIQLIPAVDTVTDVRALSACDGALESYYLDWANFTAASAESVDELLNSFWRRYLVQDDRHQALRLLDLEEPVTLQQIKKRYRERAMLWHPDRGGSDDQLAELNSALDVLQRYYA